MIYIDPPYNTGKDFIYKDNFTQKKDEYEEEMGTFDEEGNRLFLNTESNGRFHSDWCSMIYPRLKLSHNLLRDDGIIFISINDYEFDNLRKMCNEVFGESNSLTESPTALVWQQSGTTAGHFANAHEYILVYAKNKKALPFFSLSDYGDDSIIKQGALKKISKANPASEITFIEGIDYEVMMLFLKGNWWK
jgi:adenine-specific DNA-methyltransferase